VPCCPDVPAEAFEGLRVHCCASSSHLPLWTRTEAVRSRRMAHHPREALTDLGLRATMSLRPLRVVVAALGVVLLNGSTAAAAVVSVSPADGAALTAPTAVSFVAQADFPQINTEVATKPELDPDGTLADANQVESLSAVEDENGVATVHSGIGYRPGTYYWQASTAGGEVGGVRSLQIVPPPAKLPKFSVEFGGLSNQRVSQKPLRIIARCSIACQVTITATASVITGKGKRPVPNLAIERITRLEAKSEASVGRVFVAERAKSLADLIKRYGRVTFDVKMVGSDSYGRTATVARRYSVLPRPKPKESAPATRPQGERQDVEDAADAAVKKEFPGAIWYIADCRKLDPGFWECRYTGNSPTRGNIDGYVSVRKLRYGWRGIVTS